MFDLSTSCVIIDKEDQMMPATCTESNQQGCSCQCSEGFETDNDIISILSCLSKIISWLEFGPQMLI